MYILGIIPARGGSKRLPKKNIRLLNNKPLIEYVIQASKESKFINKTIVSTDCQEIAAISNKLGAEVPFMRPDYLANDSACSEDVLRHAVTHYENLGQKIDLIVMLQPTSPLTTGELIDSCINELIEKKWDSVVTALAPSKRCEWIGLNDNGRFQYILDSEMRNTLIGKEEVAPSGNVYVMTRDSLFKNPKIFTDKTGLFFVSRETAVDIDYQADFDYAEFLLQR